MSKRLSAEERKEPKRDVDFEHKLIEKPISIWCWCDIYQQTGREHADGWNCFCNLLYKQDREEIETGFFLKHIGFAKSPLEKYRHKL